MLRKILSGACLALLFTACAGEVDDAPQTRLGDPASVSLEALDGAEPGVIRQGLVGDGSLCSACETSADCGGANDYCLRRSDGVSFCGQDCSASACPSGYSCWRLGWSVYQCVPPQAECSLVEPEPEPEPEPDPDPDPDPDPGDPSGTGEVPDNAYCAEVDGWTATWSQYEEEVVYWTNQVRATGANCGGEVFGPAPALSMDPALRCAARVHSMDMAERGYFSHTSPDGVTFVDRIESAGYRWRTVGENIAMGYRSPESVVDGWVGSPGHCRNLMNPSFADIGVGFYDGYYWSQELGLAR